MGEGSDREGRGSADGGGDRAIRKARRVRRDGKRKGRRVPLKFLLPALLVLIGGGIVAWRATRPDDENRLLRKLEFSLDLVNRREYGAARKLVEEFLAERPGDPRGDYLLGISQYFLGEEEEGVARVEAALKQRPRLRGAHLFLARHYLAHEYAETALEQASAATEPEAARLEAQILESLGRLQGASEAYSKAYQKGLRDFPLLFAALAVNRTLAERLGGTGSLTGGSYAQKEQNLVKVIRGEIESRLSDGAEDPEALLASARLGNLSRELEPGVVIRRWEEAVQADPGSVAARQGLANHLLGRGEVAEAIDVLEEGREVSDTPEAWLALADLLFLADRTEEALQTVSGARERWPADPALIVAHGSLLLKADRAAEAEAELAQGIEEYPENVPLLSMSGDVRAASGDREGAEERYLRARAIRPRRRSLLERLVALRVDDLLAAVARGGELPPELSRTRDLLDELLALNRRDRQGMLWAAALAEARGRHELALNQLNDLLRYHPDEIKARSMRGRILLERQDNAGASAELAKVVESPRATVEDFLMYCRAALAFGKLEKVVETCGRGIERWPGEAQLHAYRGEALLRMNRGDRFLDLVEGVPEEVRTDPRIVKLTAWALMQAEDEAEAERRFRALLSEGRMSPGEFARFLFEAGRPEEANRFLREEIDRQPDSAEARVRMARYLLEGGDREGARELYQEAIRADENSVPAIVGFADLLLTEPHERDVDSQLTQIVARLEALEDGAADALYVEGRRRLRNRDGKGAVEKLGRLVRIRPDRYEAHLHLATAQLMVGRVEAAEAELRKSIDLRPDDPEARHRLAGLLFRSAAVRLSRGDADGARALYESVLRVRGDHQPARLMLGCTLLGLGLPSMTEEQCRDILKKDPKDAVAHLLLAMIRAGENRPAEALDELDIVVKSAPDHPVVRMMRGMARIDVADGPGALEDFRVAEKNGYRGAMLAYGRAHACLVAGDRDRALAVAEDAARSTPRNPLVWRLVGEIRTARNEYVAAAEAMLKGHEILPDNQWFLAGAVSLFALAGQPDRAAAALAGVGERTPILQAAEGDLERVRGNLDRAAELYRASAVTDPRMLIRLAEIAGERGDTETEFKCYAEARERGVDAPSVRFMYGALLVSRGEFRKAREELEAVAARLPEHPAVLNNLALAHLGEGGDRGRALALARKIVSLSPEDPRLSDTLGWALLLNGETARAVEVLERSAAELDTAESRYHLGAALAAAGRKEEARESLARALKEEPDAIWSSDAAGRLNALR